MADVLFQSGCSPLQPSCSWPCVEGRNPSEATRGASASLNASSELIRCLAAVVWYAAGTHAARVSYQRIAAWSCFPLSGGFFSEVANTAGHGCRRSTTRARCLCAMWRCFNSLSKAAAGIGL